MKKNYPTNLGKWITEHNFTPSGFATEYGFNRQLCYNWCKGTGKPGLESAAKIIEVTDLELVDLLDKEEESTIVDVDDL